MLHDQVAWWIAGPVLGLCVVAVRALFNARLGVTGGFSEIIGRVGRGSLAFDWRGWFALGIVGGGFIYLLLMGGPAFTGWSWLTETFTGGARVVVPVALALGGVAIGYGAKRSGGCTSGNGLSGIASLSPASLAATATFFGTAIAVAVTTEVVF